MKKIVSMILSAALLFSTVITAVANEENVLYKEDFSNGISSFDILKGEGFSNQNNSLYFKSNYFENAENVAMSKKITTENAEIELSFSAKDSCNAGVFFRMKDIDTYYVLRFNYRENVVSMLRKVGGGSEKLIKQGKFSLNDNEIYKLRISAINEKCNVYINDILLFTAEDDKITTGKLGFYASMGSCYFDDIKVYRLSGVDYSVKSDENSAADVTIYVSSDGNDSNDGSENSPLKTFDAARKKANELKKTNKVIDVIFKGGEYSVEDTFKLSSNDSGHKKGVIRYKGEENAEVIFSGAKKINASGFKKVTDENILKRIPDSAEERVLYINLQNEGLSKEFLDFTKLYNDTSKTVWPWKAPGVFYNDAAQSLARWPNSGYSRVVSGEVSTEGNIIHYEDVAPSRWATADNMFIEGYLQVNWAGGWAKVKKLDFANLSLQVNPGSRYANSEPDHRYAAVNLIEELDIPGEWYIDGNIMYWYPLQDFDAEKDIFEIGDDHTLLEFDGAENITFENIEFAKTSPNSDTFDTDYSGMEGGNGIAVLNSKNITIKNCTVRDVGQNGIYARNNENLLVEGCNIYNIGLNGIYSRNSGAVLEDKASGNVIRNCRIDNISKNARDLSVNPVRIVRDCGIVIENNILSNCPGPAISYAGNDIQFRNNEVYNAVMEMGDCGAIYAGRSWIEYGNVFENNFVHSVGRNIGSYDATTAKGVYMDDMITGQTFRGNIFYIGKKEYSGGLEFSGGRDNVATGNTFINANYGFYAADRAIDATQFNSLVTLYSFWESYYQNPVFTKKYPGVSELSADLLEGKYYRKSTITDNLTVDCNSNKIDAKFKEEAQSLENNQVVDTYDIFVNPDALDFRVKTDAKKKYNISDEVLDENFNLDSIGFARKALDLETKLLYPYNNGTAPNDELELVWEKTDDADSYTYEIAEDENFSNIIKSETTRHTSATVTGLEVNKTYYWRVTATTDARRDLDKKSVSEVYRFMAVANTDLDKSYLTAKIKEVEGLLSEIQEGSNAGDFKAGTKAKWSEKLAEAKAVATDKNSTKTEVDEWYRLLVNISTSLDSEQITKYKSLDLGEKWNVYPENSGSDVLNGELIFGERATYSYSEKWDLSNILCFKTKVENELDSYIGYAINQPDKDMQIWSGDYYVVIKKDVFELQEHGRILKTAENNGVFTSGRWHEIQIGVIPVMGGVNIVFSVDGKMIFDEISKTQLYKNDGYFAVQAANNIITVAKTDKVAAGEFELSEISRNINEGLDAEIVTTYSNNYSESGNWTESKLQGYGAEKVRVTSDGGLAKWSLSGVNNKIYGIYLYKPSGTSSGTFKVTASNGAGSWEKIYSMAELEDGFNLIGTFKFAYLNVTGSLDVTITNISGETPVCSLMKLEENDASDMLEETGGK